MGLLEEIEKMAYDNMTEEQRKHAEDFRKAAKLAGDAIQSMGSPLNIGKYMMSLALDREEPIDVQEAIEFFGQDTLAGELSKKRTETRKELESKEREEVSITSCDGLKLVGHVIRAKKEKRIIIAFHGWRSKWSIDFSLISNFLYENGFTVLYVEQRAQGNSEGEYLSFGVFEKLDCIDWVHFAEKYFGTKIPIYLMGISMGASTVLMASSYKFPNNVKGIIADCGFTSLTDIWKHVAVDCLHVIYPAQALEKLCYEKIRVNPSKHSTINALRNATLPVLFIHGQDDSFVPMEMTIENYDACSSEKYILLVPKAEHSFSYYVEPKRYEEAMFNFIENCEK